MADDRHRVASERQLGFEQGEAFDRRLREQELAEREERLDGSDWALDDWDAPDLEPGLLVGRPPLALLQLQDENKHLRFFYHAVQNSRAWRLTQRLRAMVGRAW